MKKILLLICVFYYAFSVQAQKVDLDKYQCSVSYQKLPSEPVPYANRTYGVAVKVGNVIRSYVDESNVYDQVILSGWKKVEENPTVGVDIALNDFIERGSEVQSRVVENKDKDGKVTSRTTYFFMVAKYALTGSAKITGPYTPQAPTARELEAQKMKEEAASKNKFLKNAELNNGETNSPKVKEWVMSLNQEVIYSGPETTDAKKARDHFSTNRSSIFNEYMRNAYGQSMGAFKNYLNGLYGYKPINDREILWIMDAKGEEGETQKEAIQAVKTILSEMKADQPIDQIKENMKPLIEYFESLKTKYSSKDKGDRKIRYSSFYNLAKIYLIIDEPEKAIKEAEGLIANDYDTRDGERLISDAKTMIKEFERANLRSRHNPTLE